VLTVPAMARLVAGIRVFVISKHMSPCRLSKSRYKCVMAKNSVKVIEYVRVVAVEDVSVGDTSVP
jgi:hypothetical protein